MTVLVFYSLADAPAPWQRAITALTPRMKFRAWPDWGDPLDADYALVWRPPAGELQKLKNLKAIFSLGAGIDHLASDPDLPRDVPIIRMVDRTLTVGMSEYIVMQVLYHHRRMFTYREQQQQQLWQVQQQVPPWKRRVGIMGMGVLGRNAAHKLALFEFDLAAWSATPKKVGDVTSYFGDNQLPAFLKRSDILIVLLPLTDKTRDILNQKRLAMLPRDASVINVGRGPLIDEHALLACLNNGHLYAASLDVFETEPLPQDHPFWSHPRVLITPHCASMTLPETAVAELVANIRLIESGGLPAQVVDLTRGY